jgi:hypothetical protein
MVELEHEGGATELSPKLDRNQFEFEVDYIKRILGITID